MKNITIAVFVLLNNVSAVPFSSLTTSPDEKQGRDNQIVGNKVKRHFDFTNLLFDELAELYQKHVASNQGTNNKTTLVPITDQDSDIIGAEQVHNVTITDLPISTETATDVPITTVLGTAGKRRYGVPVKGRMTTYEASLFAIKAEAEAEKAVKIAIPTYNVRKSAIDAAILARKHSQDAEKLMHEASLSSGFDSVEYIEAVSVFVVAEILARAAWAVCDVYASAQHREFVNSRNDHHTDSFSQRTGSYARNRPYKIPVDSINSRNDHHTDSFSHRTGSYARTSPYKIPADSINSRNDHHTDSFSHRTGIYAKTRPDKISIDSQ